MIFRLKPGAGRSFAAVLSFGFWVLGCAELAAIAELDATIRGRQCCDSSRGNPKLKTQNPKPGAAAAMIRSFIFSDGKLVGQDLELEALRLVRSDKGLLLWVDLDRPTPEEIKNILEGVFQFHPLAIEDCVAPNSLPKVEDYEDYLFIVTHAVDFTRRDKFNTTELDLFLGRDYLVTFHTAPLRSVSTMIERFTKSAGVGPRGPDRISHTLIDLLVDNYAPVIEELRAELEELEEHVLSKDSSHKSLVTELLHVRNDFTRLRTIVRPQRDVIDRMARGDSKLIRPKLLPYFRDLRDNLVRLEDTAAGYHERLLWPSTSISTKPHSKRTKASSS